MVRRALRAAGAVPELVTCMLALPAEKTSCRRPRTPALLAATATWALREEAQLTPKPALVDRRGSGAHRDMSLQLLLRSAATLERTFALAAQAAATMSFGVRLRERLARIGIDGETAMLRATGGINTHRGAIWSLGLLCAAAVRQTGTLNATEACEQAGLIARLPLAERAPMSHGRRMFVLHGAGGARGEAEDGFPHVHKVALPALRSARRRGTDECSARLHALISLIAYVDDTCLLHRGGRAALEAAQAGARTVLALGVWTPPGRRALLDLDRDLVGRNASPGGSADLLAATLFVDRIITTEDADGNA